MAKLVHVCAWQFNCAGVWHWNESSVKTAATALTVAQWSPRKELRAISNEHWTPHHTSCAIFPANLLPPIANPICRHTSGAWWWSSLAASHIFQHTEMIVRTPRKISQNLHCPHKPVTTFTAEASGRAGQRLHSQSKCQEQKSPSALLLLLTAEWGGSE